MEIGQYAIMLVRGKDTNIKKWIWADQERIQKVVEKILFGRVCERVGGSIDCSISTKDGYSELAISQHKDSRDKSNVQLELLAANELLANRLAQKYGLPEPFSEVNGNYILNRYGD